LKVDEAASSALLMDDDELESRMAEVLGLEPSFVDYLRQEWQDIGCYKSFQTFILDCLEQKLEGIIPSDQPGEISKELFEDGFTREQVDI
jgi:hypothetical protein